MAITMLSEHFSVGEFRCHCGVCVPVLPPKELIDGLEDVRRLFGGKPIIITSGHRCALWNKKVGGVKNSKHILARAADIVIKGVAPHEIAAIIKYLVPTLRALPYRDYTHVELR